MDYFYDVFTTSLGLESGSCVNCQWRDIKLSDFICVPKMNESLGKTWRLVINDNIYIFGASNPLTTEQIISAC